MAIVDGIERAAEDRQFQGVHRGKGRSLSKVRKTMAADERR
jgi:hypothetical protein